MTKQHISTKLVHGGEAPDAEFGAIAPLLVRTKTFRQPRFGKESKWQYSRGKNPTRSILEAKLESLLDNKGQAAVFSTGDAATTVLLLNLKPNDHIVCSKELYGGTIRLIDQLFKDYGIRATYVDLGDVKALNNNIQESTKFILTETISNPCLNIVDLNVISKIAIKHKVQLIVDATFTPPNVINPFDYGADTVLYSLSKYIGGHNDSLGGALITKNKSWHERHTWLQWTVGATLSPDECYRFIQEIKTLDLRWRRVSETAVQLAKYLQESPKVKKVNYPSLYKLSKFGAVYTNSGFGSVVSFELHEQEQNKLEKFVNDIQKDNIVVFAESLSSPETILSHPATMSHRSLTNKQRSDIGINYGFFRLSVGFEDAGDIIRSTKSALKNL